MRETMTRVWLPREPWRALKRLSAREGLPVASFASLLIKNYVQRPWKLELLPESRDEDKE